MKTKIFGALATFVLATITFQACTSNPVGDDGIGGGRRSITGAVQLDSQNQPDRVYVWLDAFDVGVYTDSKGEFTLTIPASGADNVAGVFKLYFFVANYKLDFEEVSVRNGEFLYDQASLDSKGRLRVPKRLEQFLFITSDVEPPSIRFGSTDNIEVSLELMTNRTVADSATVVFPKTTAGVLGPIFFQNAETKEVFIFETLPVDTQEKVLVGGSPVTRSAILTFNALNLPAASYVVIPFLLVRHQEIPGELLHSIGSNLQDLTPNYLRMPFARQGGHITVMPVGQQ